MDGGERSRGVVALEDVVHYEQKHEPLKEKDNFAIIFFHHHEELQLHMHRNHFPRPRIGSGNLLCSDMQHYDDAVKIDVTQFHSHYQEFNSSEL